MRIWNEELVRDHQVWNLVRQELQRKQNGTRINAVEAVIADGICSRDPLVKDNQWKLGIKALVDDMELNEVRVDQEKHSCLCTCRSGQPTEGDANNTSKSA